MDVKTISVLLIEDNPGDARLIQEMLKEDRSTRFLTKVAGRLNTGLAYLEEESFDVVLLDLSLPDSHGLDTVYTMLETAPDLPIVVLTGNENEMVGTQAVQKGAQDYLAKGDAGGRLLSRAMRYAIERKRIEDERNELIADLDAYAHTVAHGLKEPIGVIIGYADLLHEYDTELSREERKQYSASIVQQGLTMGHIIDELLLLASVHRENVVLNALEMGAIVDEALERLAKTIDDHGATVVTPQSWPRAIGHRPWVIEIWVNYITNALKYGGDPPHIELGATRPGNDHDPVTFWVQDNGPGISAEAQGRLFTPFTRLGPSDVGGHGLGLSIVRRISEKLGGQAGVESEAGHGSRFYFTLPAA